MIGLLRMLFIIGIAIIILGIAFWVLFLNNVGLTNFWEVVKNTGSLGDTFGGLSSPLIGLFTIYYVIKTFKDQSRINKLTGSSLFFNELNELILNTKNQIGNFEFSDKLIQNHVARGVDSMNNFRVIYESSTSDIISRSGNDLLNSMINMISETNLIINSFNDLNKNELLTVLHKSIIEKKLIDLVQIQLQNLELVFIVVNQNLSHKIEIIEEINPQSYGADNVRLVNNTFIIYRKYQNKINELSKLGYISITEHDSTEFLLSIVNQITIIPEIVKKIDMKIYHIETLK